MRNADSSLRGVFPLILLLMGALTLIAIILALLQGVLILPPPREAAALPTKVEETTTQPPTQTVEISPTSTSPAGPAISTPTSRAGESTPSITRTPTLPSTPPTATETPPPSETPLPSSTPYPSPTQESALTRTPFPLVTPAGSPAGSIVYLMRLENGNYTLNTLNINDAGEVSSSSALTLPLSPDEPGGTVYPSADGARLAWMYPVEIDYEIYIINVSTGDIEQKLTNIAAFFGWHPDNRHVLIENSPASGLWLVDLQSDRDTPLDVRGFGEIRSAAISPDGRRVIYTIQKDASSPEEVWVVGDDGRNARHLDWLSGGAFFSWSPDGGRILTYYTDGWALLNAQGSDPRQIAAFTGFAPCYPIAPHWSPLGNRLTIVTEGGGESFCQGWSETVFQGTNISMVDTNTGFAVPLPGSGNIDPTWSPDGSLLAFVSSRSGSPEIWVVNADGSNLRQLTDANQYVRFPFWRRP